jgi:hypothetical protein
VINKIKTTIQIEEKRLYKEGNKAGLSTLKISENWDNFYDKNYKAQHLDLGCSGEPYPAAYSGVSDTGKSNTTGIVPRKKRSELRQKKKQQRPVQRIRNRLTPL